MHGRRTTETSRRICATTLLRSTYLRDLSACLSAMNDGSAETAGCEQTSPQSTVEGRVPDPCEQRGSIKPTRPWGD